MVTLQFDPPDKPWSTNQDRNLHPHTRHKKVNKWKQASKDAWTAAGHPPITGFVIVELEIPFTQNRRRDAHNYCGTVLKATIDGLVEAGAFEDDSTDHLGHREPVLKKGGPVTVRLTVI